MNGHSRNPFSILTRLPDRCLKPAIAALFALGLMTGCATMPELPPEEQVKAASAWEAHQQKMQTLDDWQLSGRAAISTPDGGGNVTLHWVQVGAHYDMSFSAPLGQGTLRVIGGPGEVLLVDDRGRESRSDDADALIHELTGWRVPVSALPFWIRGLPASDEMQYRISRDGRLERISHDGWTVHYDHYQQQAGYLLPVRLRMDAEDITLRLVVDQWDIDPPPEAIDAARESAR